MVEQQLTPELEALWQRMLRWLVEGNKYDAYLYEQITAMQADIESLKACERFTVQDYRALVIQTIQDALPTGTTEVRLAEEDRRLIEQLTQHFDALINTSGELTNLQHAMGMFSQKFVPLLEAHQNYVDSTLAARAASSKSDTKSGTSSPKKVVQPSAKKATMESELEELRAYKQKHRKATVADVMQAFGWTHGTAQRRLDALKRKK